jgi:PAS domain S-box-containing protein
MNIEATNRGEMEPVSVLMVDDHPENLMALEAILSRPDYRLMKASSAEEALRQLLKHDFAVLLLDVMMPDMDGYELASLIRQREATRHIPIVFLTAVAKEIGHIYKGYSVGAVDYLTKPLEPMVVRSKVSVFVELYRKTKQLQHQERLLQEKERAKERREKEFELARVKQQEERRLADLVRTIPGVVWEFERSSNHSRPRLTFMSPSIERMLGYPVSEWLSSPDFWISVVHPKDRPTVLQNFEEYLRTGGSGKFEFRWIDRWGNPVWIESQYAEVRNDAGAIIGLKGVALDVSDRVKAREELKRAKEAAESANRMKSAFLANMSHEIRTPLGAILGFSELAKESCFNPGEQEGYLDIIIRNGQNLTHLINDILDLSKVESGHMSIEPLKVDIEDQIAEVLSTLKEKAHGKGVGLELTIADHLPSEIVTDPVRFTQVLMNLTDNAIKFTSCGAVEIRVSYAADDLHIVIKDTGIGISEEERERLFQPFIQADGSTTRRFGGTGLGLALSQRLARLLGGDVILKRSQPGVGSEFEFTLRNLKESASAKSVKEAPSDFTKTNFQDPHLLEGRRILVVDDSPDNRHFVMRMLDRLGAEVECAENGKQGLERALQETFDLILMDIQMPVLDGYNATTRLRESGYRKPIIALTAHALNEDRVECLRVGCSDYLSKPVNKKELASAILKHTLSH